MKYRQSDDARPTPLSPQVFQILVSLLDGPRHGYAIIQDIRERTTDEIRLTASTLYDALGRLVDYKWIEETGGPADETAGGGARRYYRLTPLGQKVARSEAERLERLLGTVRGTRLFRSKRS